MRCKAAIAVTVATLGLNLGNPAVPAKCASLDSADYRTLAPGQTVRVKIVAAVGAEAVTRTGVIVGIAERSVLLRSSRYTRAADFSRIALPEENLEVSFESIVGIEARHDEGSHAIEGLVLGAALGGIFGVVARDDDSDHPIAPALNATMVGLSLVAGMTVGGLLGSSIPKASWIPVSLETYGPAEPPAAHAGEFGQTSMANDRVVGLELSCSF